MKKILAIALVLVLVLTASASAELTVCHHADGHNCVAQRNVVGSVALEAPAKTYATTGEVKAAGFEALLSTTGVFNAVFNGSASIVERYTLVLSDNTDVPTKDGKLAVEDCADDEEEEVKAPADFGTVFAVVRAADGRFYGAVVICCCGGNGGNGGNGDHPVRTMGDHPAERPTDALASSNQGNEGPATTPATTTTADNGNSIKVETDVGTVIISFNTTPVASEGGEHGERPAAQ